MDAIENFETPLGVYRQIFSEMDAGFCIIEMKFDAEGQATDYLFVEVNDAFESQTGLSDVNGRWMRDLAPAHEQYWFDIYGSVAMTGEAMKFESRAEQLDRWFEVQAFRVGGDSKPLVAVMFSDISERKQTEETLRQSEMQFRTLAEAMPNQVWTATPDGMLDWFNSRVYEFSGAEPAALNGNGWTRMVHPDDLARASERWATALSSRKGYETEFRLRNAAGEYRWHLARAVPVGDDTHVQRWIGTNTDIHDHKASERALAASEARLRLAIEAGQMAVWELDPATADVVPTPEMNVLYGFEPDETPTAEQYQSRLAPGERERIRAIAAQAQADDLDEFEVEARHIWPDGTEKWLFIRARSVDGIADDGASVLGVALDVTKRKQAEDRLRRSEQRLRLSQEAGGIGSLELDIETGEVIGSDNFWKLWGLSKRDSVHISTLENIVIPADRNIRSNEETRQQGTAETRVQYRIQRPDDGRVRWLARQIEFVHDENGRPTKMFGVVQDITELKDAQARQEMLMHELEHRIKNILASVSAIAAQTFRNHDYESAKSTFFERLMSLSRAHDLLTRTHWEDTTIHEVMGVSLTPLPKDRIRVSGPDLKISPKAATTLALSINELATNSMKYGALSIDGGHVDIDWKVDRPGANDVERLVWVWEESGGPPVVAPTRKGFGTFLIERALAADFSGVVDLDYHADGLRCVLDAPVPSQVDTGV